LTINTPEAVETLEWMVKFTNDVNGGISNVTDFWQNTRDTSPDYPFYQDRNAVLFHNVALFGHMQNNDPDMYKDPSQWGIALRPYNGNNTNATHHGDSGLSFAWGYVIPREHPQELRDAAWKFAEFLTTNEKGSCYFMFNQGRPSPLKSCNENPQYSEANPYWDTVLKALETDLTIPITPAQSEINAVLKEAVDKAAFGQAPAKQALDDAAKAGQAIIDKYWSS
jgi:ABC-type glycerol-3-phosphate transport system substrate-binding protein